MEVIDNMVTLQTLSAFRNAPEVRPLPSPGVTRLQRYCEPVRLPARPDLSLAGVPLARQVPPDRVSRVAQTIPLPRAVTTTPAGPGRDLCRSPEPWRRPSPSGWRVGSCDDRFRGLLGVHRVPPTIVRHSVTARWLAEWLKPPFDTKGFLRLRYLHRHFGCFRLERPICRVGLTPTG
jgi:hypothetical protein